MSVLSIAPNMFWNGRWFKILMEHEPRSLIDGEYRVTIKLVPYDDPTQPAETQ